MTSFVHVIARIVPKMFRISRTAKTNFFLISGSSAISEQADAMVSSGVVIKM